jgi:glycosyltransferase involved in cell wall biosynthesis
VVAANSSCLPEVLQDSVIYTDPKSPQQISESIYEGITNQELVKNKLESADKLLKKYSWKKLAERTLNIYKKNL